MRNEPATVTRFSNITAPAFSVGLRRGGATMAEDHVVMSNRDGIKVETDTIIHTSGPIGNGGSYGPSVSQATPCFPISKPLTIGDKTRQFLIVS